MTADAPVVWLAEATPEASQAVAEWALARGVRLVAPAPNLEGRAYSEADAAAVELALARAREATAQLDGDAADRALARAEARLRAHPELPQAAWLLAEVQRGWAARFSRVEPRDEARARRALAAADALDGGRAAGVGEPSAPRAAPVAFTLEATLEPDVTLLLDGRPVSPGALQTPAGEHHLTATAFGRVRYAEFVTVVPGARVALEVTGAAPCSAEDLARAHAGRAGVRCGAWVTAAPAPRGVSVSMCSGAACEPMGFFAKRTDRPPLAPAERPGRFPGWVAWSLAGVGAAGAALGILAGAGVFAPAERRIVFVQGGVRSE